MNHDLFTLETQVSPEITIRTVEERERYVSYGYQHWQTEEILGVYRDELSAREGHLRWVKHNWVLAAYLKKCGYDEDNFTGKVTVDDRTQITGNNKSGNHQGEVCLP